MPTIRRHVVTQTYGAAPTPAAARATGMRSPPTLMVAPSPPSPPSPSPPSPPPPPVPPRPPIVVQTNGHVRSSLLGFLIGAAAAGSLGAVLLIDEMHTSMSAVLSEVDDVSVQSKRVSDSMARVEALDRTVAQLHHEAATREDVAALRTELLHALDEVQELALALKAKQWEHEHDLAILTGRRPLGS
ncbi:hypothetical protein CXG81DRAFT_28461 [Caulochytrium protostelioides]|uniref:Uncharacterized protein n=1 Tax=Caulochytrium protostelioides TaxID=1555241 RepID=A0A4P9WZ03_9FUNG|nr:hypothetical protein CXG81DRAFT_28461 [Caulochytrium protostelioides]|eukprot:RKO98741.1 hypothetical protein CXG81DRAFT_28461 [Caulochytrium protostelioides]